MALSTKRTSLLAAALVIAAAAQTAGAQDSTTTEPAPFQFSKTPMGKAVSTLNPMNWKMPQFKRPSVQQVMPTQDEKTRIKERKNSLVTEVSETAGRSWKKTKQVLNPKRLLPSNLFAAKPDLPTQPKDQQVEQVGFFESLLRPLPPREKPSSSVNEFLKQEKPQ